jgi:hypothetical protein
MAKADIYSGNCGMTTTVEATMNGKGCKVSITSNCEAIRKIAKELTEVNPYKERDSATSPIMKGEKGHKQGACGKMGWASFSGQKCWQKRCFGATSRERESNKSG